MKDEEKDTGRIEAFSDGVFAIAITLLALELKIPHAVGGGAEGLVRALVNQWPAYLSFVTSFCTILIMWGNHHEVFRLVRRTDTAFMQANGFLLMLVTVVPLAVESGLVRDGIMHALVTHHIPFVLAGSIRDDGPLPGVFSDVLEAQDAMREHTVRATGALLIASALHAIAVGNMLPAYHTNYGGVPTPLMTICVDQTEFVVNKLRDRGTHQAYGVVTNAQDFMHVVRFYVERWEQARTSGSPRPR